MLSIYEGTSLSHSFMSVYKFFPYSSNTSCVQFSLFLLSLSTTAALNALFCSFSKIVSFLAMSFSLALFSFVAFSNFYSCALCLFLASLASLASLANAFLALSLEILSLFFVILCKLSTYWFDVKICDY